MAKFDDKQIDVTVGSQVIHSPSGTTPAHGADAPFVHPQTAGQSAGKAITPINIATVFQRIANPAAILLILTLCRRLL